MGKKGKHCNENKATWYCRGREEQEKPKQNSNLLIPMDTIHPSIYLLNPSI